MELKRELGDLPTEARALFQECRDVFISETQSSFFDGQAVFDELESKVQEGFKGLTDERAASKMSLLESLFDLWYIKYSEI